MLKEIADAIDALNTTLLAARDACRAKSTDPALWTSFEEAMRPHLNTLTSYARRGMLNDNATDMLRSAMSSLIAYRDVAMTPNVRGRRR